jgi:hypothetical protein
MKKLILAAAVIVTASSSFIAKAESYSVVCNGCSSQQTLEKVQGRAYGDWYVHDMLNRKITHYSISRGADTNSQVIRNVPITSAVQQQFDQVQALYDTTQTLNIELSYKVLPGVKTATETTPPLTDSETIRR